MPGTIAPMPGTIAPMPGTIAPMPGTIAPMPGTIAPMPGTIAPMPGTIAPMPGTIAPMPGTIAPMPGTIAPMPGTIAPMPGTIAPMPGTIASMPGTIAPMPGTIAPKRNPKRFPEDFCFQLANEEVKILRSQFATAISNMTRTNPYGFTREGANMLSVVLHTDIAIERSVQIIRAFSAMERLKYGLIEIADQFEACKRMAATSGLQGNQAILTASTLVKKLTGYDPLEILGQKQLPCKPQEVHLTPTAIGKMIGVSPPKANTFLEKAGLQESFRDAENHHCSDAWHHCSDAWHHCSDAWHHCSDAWHHGSDGTIAPMPGTIAPLLRCLAPLLRCLAPLLRCLAPLLRSDKNLADLIQVDLVDLLF